MKIINEQLLDEVTAQAQQSPRLRMNYNFHEMPEAPINRLLNAMEPDTYIRPHRHLSPPKEEIFLVLRGEAVLFIFNDDGSIREKLLLGREHGVYGAELEPGIWHSLLVIESGTVIYEVKTGPFTPLSSPDMAPWSPDPSHTDEAREYVEFLRNQAFS